MNLKSLDLSDVKVVVTDLDGTAITKDHKMLPYTVKVLNTLYQKGIKLIVATGRGSARVPMIRENLPQDVPLVLNVGAIIERVPGLHYQKVMDLSFTQAFFPHIETLIKKFYPHINISAYTPDKVYSNFIEGIPFSGGEAEVMEAPRDSIIKLFFYDRTKTHDRIKEIYEFIQENFPGEVNAVYSSPYALDITNKGIDKLGAIQTILDLWGLDAKSNMIAFGDSMNDAPMLEGAKYGFFMSNTADFIKKEFEAQGKLIPIGSNQEEGLAQALNELFSLNINYADYAQESREAQDLGYDDGVSPVK